MGVRAQLGWMVRGGTSTRAAIETLSTDLRELQQKVAGLEAALNDLRGAQAQVVERQLDDFDSIRAAVGTATDDLVARINAIDERTRGAS